MEAGDESDDCSSSSSSPSVDPLDDFREKWQQEIEFKTAMPRRSRIMKSDIGSDTEGDEEKVNYQCNNDLIVT